MSCLNLEGQLACNACVLRSKCKRVVPGHGDTRAKLMFIAEAPGADEDDQGIPLVGKAGQLFDRLLGRAGLRREDVYATNVVLCRPPSNDLHPYPEAVHTCPRLWLDKEIALVDPSVLVLMGATAGQQYFPGVKAAELAGLSRVLPDGRRVTGSFHPSYVFRQGTSIENSIVKSFGRAKELVG